MDGDRDDRGDRFGRTRVDGRRGQDENDETELEHGPFVSFVGLGFLEAAGGVLDA